jgi:hypothetical protein
LKEGGFGMLRFIVWERLWFGVLMVVLGLGGLLAEEGGFNCREPIDVFNNACACALAFINLIFLAGIIFNF